MSFYGLAGLIVWFLGSKLGLPVNFRIVVIAMILITMPFALVIGYVAKRKKKKKEAEKKDAKETTSDKSKSEKAAKPVVAGGDLNKGAEEVVKFLQESNLGASGKESVYSLPWYIVAGAPTSGKSALVLGSGLNFQPLPSQRQSEQKFIRPTGNIDWRVTSDAVFIDTAGRYQTDNGSEDEWGSIIETVKKHRQKRPIDGFLLAVNAEKLLKSDNRQIEEKAKIIRARLDEVTQKLKTRFPVYLVFTHADAIEGFRDSFSNSKKEGENLVWGTTIPLEKSDNAQSLFDSEYEILQNSIMKRRLMRLSAPFSPVRQLRIFNFPLHFGTARRKLGAFVTNLFRPSPFSESPFLRGFYFTAVPTDKKRNGKQPTANKGKTVGKTYFTKKFFRDVVLRDKDLVKTFQDQKQRPPILGWLLTAVGAFLTLFFIAMSAISLFQNRAFVNDAAEKGDAVWTIIKTNDKKNPLLKSSDEARSELNAVENLRRILIKLDKYERVRPPIYMRFGLYSGDTIYKERLLNIYYTAIEQRFQQPTLRRLERELKQFGSATISGSSSNLTTKQEDELGKRYAYLEAYLMWSGVKDAEGRYRAEPTILAKTLEPFWISESKVPPDMKEMAKAQLNFYFKQIDRDKAYENDSSGFPRISVKKEIVDGARAKLKAFPPYLRYLKRSVSEVSKEVEPVSVQSILAGDSGGTIKGTHTIPGAYTIDGYRRFMKEKIANANEELGKDDWVMGEKAGDTNTQSAEMNKLESRYFNVYTDNWRQLVSDASVARYKKQEDMDAALNAFSLAVSPMKKLLTEVARNTNFSAKPKAKGWFDFSWVSDLFSGKADDGKVNKSIVVEKEFRALFKFVGESDKKDKSSPLSKYGAAVTKVATHFADITPGKKEKITKDLANENDKAPEVKALRRAEKNIGNLLKGFDATAAGQELAKLIKQPVSNVRIYFGEGGIKLLKKEWQQRILTSAREIENGYPFKGLNDGEADRVKVTAYLNPVSGTFSKFYTGRLEKYFEEKNGQYVVKGSSVVKFTPEFVAYLNNAFRLRKTLFGENATPNFEYDFALLPIADAIVEITIDGQLVTSQETGSKAMKFPAATGASTGVLMRFSSTSGTTSTSGNPLPASTPANNSPPTVNQPLSNFLQSGEAEKRFQGAWGLFKFFDRGSAAKQPNGEYLLTYKLGGKTVKATIKPKGGDLFDKSIFRSLKAPDNLVQ